MFLEKIYSKKDICSQDYLEQVLKPVVFLLFDSLGSEYIFIEDRSKVHVSYARLP
jgi:hypothetical protein